MTLQRDRIYRMVQWIGKIPDQGVRPAWHRQSKEKTERGCRSCLDWWSRKKELPPVLQRQSREGAERDSWSCFGMVSRNRTSLKCTFCGKCEVNFIERKIQTVKNLHIRGEWWFLKVSKVTVLPFYSSSWYCSINPNRTRILFLLSLWTVSAQQTPLPVPVRTIPKQDQESSSLLPAHTVSAKQGLLPVQVAVCRHRTVTPNPGLVTSESFMEASGSAGALIKP